MLRKSGFTLILFLSLSMISLVGSAKADWLVQQSGTTASLNRVFFLNPQTGWACGETSFVLRTTNGGQLWQRETVDSNYSMCSLWFQDMNQGWICGVKDGSGHMVSAVFSTTDGGMRWQEIKKDTTNVLYFDLEFVTSLKGWLVGVKPMSNGGGEGYLYYTSDGGVSWVLKDSSTSTLYNDVSFADSLYGFLAAGNPGVLQSSGFLKKTTDGGTSWQGQSLDFVMYRWVYCLDRDHIWRSEYYHNDPNPNRWGVSKSSDGGVTWGPILNRTRNLIPGPPFAVVDTLKTWVLVRDTLYGSRDGGITWTTQEPYSYMNNLCFVDSMNGWIVGNQGLILNTKDGGSGILSELQDGVLRFCKPTVRPNPMRDRAIITFDLLPASTGETSSIEIYNIAGELVRKLDSVERSPGKIRAIWNGRNQNGHRIPPGIYFISLSSLSIKQNRQIVVIR